MVSSPVVMVGLKRRLDWKGQLPVGSQYIEVADAARGRGGGGMVRQGSHPQAHKSSLTAPGA